MSSVVVGLYEINYALLASMRKGIEALKILEYRDKIIAKKKYDIERNELISKYNIKKERLKTKIEYVKNNVDLNVQQDEFMIKINNEIKFANDIIQASVEKITEQELQNIDKRLFNIEKYARIILRYKKNIEYIGTKLYTNINTGSERLSRKNQEVLEKIKLMFEEIDTLNLSEELYEKVNFVKGKIEKNNIVEDFSVFLTVDIVPLYNACKEYDALYNKHNELLYRYYSLINIFNIRSQTFLCNKTGIEKLEKEIDYLDKKLTKKYETEIISEVVSNTMEEMGYNMCGNKFVKKKKGANFSSTIYRYSDDEVIDVTCSENGQISMEIGKIDNIDRIPNEKEQEKLVDDMRGFCSKFDEINRKLYEKGIINSEINKLPPTIEYAQIINLDDYNIVDGVEFPICMNKQKNKMKEEKIINGEG